MKLYVRELPQKQYHYQSYDYPILPNNHTPTINDSWTTIWNKYTIDKISHNTKDLFVYATKTKLDKPNHNCNYKKGKNK